jgi:ribosomal protein S18 acetylase RimI-like enzyme
MIRPARESELDYVYSTWTHAIVGRQRINSLRAKHLIAQVDEILERAPTLVDVRASARPDGEVVGWICYTPLQTMGVVHWIYVRKAHRREGIARGLCAAARVDLTRMVPYTSESTAAKQAIAALPFRTHHVPMKDVL